MTFVCKTCGRSHEGGPRDIGFIRPAEYFTVPEAEHKSRCKITDDWCIIDNERFFIRCIALVPLLDADDCFAWGLWAEIAQNDFQAYMDLYHADGSMVPAFPGRLSGEHRGYEGLDGHAVSIQLGSAPHRPEMKLEPSDHLLYREQRDGITLHRVAEILHAVFPNEYP